VVVDVSVKFAVVVEVVACVARLVENTTFEVEFGGLEK
jgi:DNA topoisomerase VI subunit A